MAKELQKINTNKDRTMSLKIISVSDLLDRIDIIGRKAEVIYEDNFFRGVIRDINAEENGDLALELERVALWIKNESKWVNLMKIASLREAIRERFGPDAKIAYFTYPANFQTRTDPTFSGPYELQDGRILFASENERRYATLWSFGDDYPSVYPVPKETHQILRP